MAYGNVAVDVIQSSTTGTPVQFQDGSGNQIGTLCRAWVNFNGVSGSVAIRASFNVSSITRTATGTYTIAFTNAFADTNYGVTGSARNTSTGDTLFQPLPDSVLTTSSISVTALNATNGSTQDATYVYCSVFR
jgi:hypothetical protein